MGLKPRSTPASEPFSAILAKYVEEIWKLDGKAQLNRLLETIEQCPDAEALWQLMTTEDLRYTTMTADGGMDSLVTEGIFAHVASWEPDKRARGLAVMGLLATLSLAHTFDASALATVKVAELNSLDAHSSAIRRWSRDPNERLREAAIMLLSRTPAADSHDLAMLQDILSGGESDSVRSAAALAIGIMARRDDAIRRAALASERLLVENLSSATPLVVCASAVALALLRGELCVETAPHLVAAFGERHPLPEVWGVYDDEKTIGGLARAAMLRLPGPGSLLSALIDKASPVSEQDLLMRIGFGCEAVNMDNRGSAPDYKLRYSEVPAGGIAREVLEDHQERILELLVRRRTAWHLCAPLGFWDVAAELPDFLAGERPQWRAFEVEDLSGVERRWHIPLLWRRYVFGPLVARDRAVQVMVNAMPSKTLLNVILNWNVRRVIERSQPNRDDRTRDKQLFVATLKAIRGYDVRADITGKISNQKLRLAYEPAALGLCLEILCSIDGAPMPTDTRSTEVLHASAKMFGKG
jgi:hypothetical protein